MSRKKTLREREAELQAMLADPAGRQAIQELKDRYQAASDRVKPERTSVITYLLVYEREQGTIVG